MLPGVSAASLELALGSSLGITFLTVLLLTSASSILASGLATTVVVLGNLFSGRGLSRSSGRGCNLLGLRQARNDCDTIDERRSNKVSARTIIIKFYFSQASFQQGQQPW